MYNGLNLQRGAHHQEPLPEGVTLEIMQNMVDLGMSNKDIGWELDIDVARVWYELGKNGYHCDG